MPAVKGAKKHRWENEDGTSKTGRTGAPKDPEAVGGSVFRRYQGISGLLLFIKTKENEIWVIEEDGEIQSMLQLNPYQLQVAEHPFLCRYIIAVATRAQYRSRGYMSSLLRKAMQEMYGKKEPFTFLMPAAEAIYTPYDFRFVYSQRQAVFEKRQRQN